MGQRASKRGIGWILLLGLCLLVIGAALVVPRWIDWTQYRDELTDLIGTVTGRRVAIDGDVRLTLLPTPSFRAEEVRLGEAAGERSPLFLRADAIQADLDLGALLLGTIRVSALTIEHPVAEFLDLPTGTDFLGFGRATLERVRIIDGEAGSPLMDAGDRLTAIEADLIFGKPGDAPRLNATFRHRSLPWRIEAALGRTLSLNLGPRGGGPTLRLIGTLAEDGGTRFIGKLKGEGARATELAHLLGFGVPKPAEGRFALDSSVDLTPNGLSLHDLTLTLGDQRLAGSIALAWTDHLTWQASLRTARLDLDALRGPWQAPLVPRTDSSIPEGTLTFAADAVAWRSGLLRQARVSATWNDGAVTVSEAAVVLPGGTDIALSGAVLPDEDWRFAGRGEFGGDDPRPALVWAGLDPRWFPRGDRLRRLSGTLALAGDRNSLMTDHLDLSFDNSRVTGSVRVEGGWDRPTVTATLAADWLPLDALDPLTPWETLLNGENAFAGLQRFDGAVSLTLGETRLRDHPLRDLGFTARLVSGVLTVEEARVSGFAGTAPLTLSGTLDASTAPATLALKANGAVADVARSADLLRAPLPLTPGVEGRFTLAMTGPISRADLALTATLGGIETQWGGAWSPLAGTALLDLEAHAPSQTQALRDLGWGLAVDGDGPMSLTARIDLTRDRLQVETAALRLPDLALDARGTLALPLKDGVWKISGGVGVSVVRPALWKNSALTSGRLADALLMPLDLDLALRIGLLEHAPYALSDVAGRVRFAEGRWRFDEGRAHLYDGTLDLSGTLAFGEAEPLLTVNLALKNADLGVASAAFFDEPDADGKLSLMGTLTAKPLTLKALPSRLAGSLALEIGSGRIGGIDLPALRQALAPASEANPARTAERGLALSNAFAGGALTFTDGKGRIEIANGTAHTEGLALTVPDLQIDASGTAADLGPLTLGRVWFTAKDGEVAVLIAERRGAAWQRRLEWAER